MILRRITKHVKDQNWFAVFLDFFIVVVGILIAFQITNWSEARSASEREQEVLISILDDVKDDRITLNSSIDMAALNIDAANYALIKAGLEPLRRLSMPIEDIRDLSSYNFDVEPPRTLTPDQKNRLWSLVTVRLFSIRSDSAFESLVSAGDLSQIKNPDLIKSLQRYQQLWSSLEGSQDKSYRPYRDQAVYVGQKFGLSPFTAMSEDEFAALLAANPELVGAMRTMTEYAVLHKNQLGVVESLSADLIEKLEAETQ